MSKWYTTQFRNSRPFLIEQGDTIIKVYEADMFRRDISTFYAEPVMMIEPFIHLFRGDSDPIPSTIRIDTHGPMYNGNTILVHIQENVYMYIGHYVYIFYATDHIISYRSPVGRNNVPFPWAADRSGNIYLLNEFVVLNDRMPLIEPYGVYYRESVMTGYAGISNMLHNGNKYEFTYSPLDYEEDVVVELTDGSQKEMSVVEVSKIMKDFSDEKGYSALNFMMIRGFI